MPDSNSSSSAAASKPAKPHPDFPLFAHSNGSWAKKVKGKMRYFGPWDDPERALRQYQDFLAGNPIAVEPAADAKPNSNKPPKPYPDFPLFAHANGRWAKKIRGRLVYFGLWHDPEAALMKYQERKDDLHAGRTPRADTGELTVKDLVNKFLNQKRADLEAGELSPRTRAEYKACCDMLVSHFGKRRLVADIRQDDFAALRNKMAKRWGPHRIGKMIQYTRSVFKYGFDAELLDKTVRFGPGFKRPSKKVMRLHKAKQGVKLFTAEEIRTLLDAAGVPMKAMILLGINCGFGNSDCGNLPLSAVDLERGWVNFPRPKTGIERRCPLWGESVEAVKAALAKRPEPKDPGDAQLVFITKRGLSWTKDIADSPVTKEMRKLLDATGINGHRNFYTLRHSFRTVGDESLDQAACDFLMGHCRDDMASIYRERINDGRLRAVTDHVHRWLFGDADQGQQPDVIPLSKAN